jgi:NAD+ synthase (glutamine-hydrolysing)
VKEVVKVRVALLQLDPLVGDLDGNVAELRAGYASSVAAGARLVSAAELAIPGYPPEDLVLTGAFVEAGERALATLAEAVDDVPFVVGFVERLSGTQTESWRPVASEASGHPPIANAAAVLRRGRVEAVYRKHRLPNYGVFDEARYFRAGTQTVVFDVDGVPIGVTICEDMWGEGGPLQRTAADGAELIVNINASPYRRGVRRERERWARHHAVGGDVWIAYVAQVGGQDEVVFDGDSFVMAPDGEIVARAAQFAPDRLLVDLPLGSDPGQQLPAPFAPRLDDVAEVYAALVLGTRDYLRKNGFRAALVGISGGVDSALTATIAVDALGAHAVTGVAMPSPYSSPGSLSDAKALAANLGIGYLELPIGTVMDAFGAVLAEPFAGTEEGVAEENIQSRIRGTLLMALSNKRGDIVLSTGNKSEYAVGYATLYGDMAGGLAVLKDVTKTLVWELARWRNAQGDGERIPRSSIEKAPSAELRPGQRDTDSLLPYDLLDPILEAVVEDGRSVADLAAAGYDEGEVRDVVRLIDRAEYKRRQAAPGVKISARAFGKDRRMPITQAWPG